MNGRSPTHNVTVDRGRWEYCRHGGIGTALTAMILKAAEDVV